MSNTLTVRLPEDVLVWLKQMSRRTGVPVGRIVREQLERARTESGSQSFLRYAGAITGGPSNVSSRKGFRRS